MTKEEIVKEWIARMRSGEYAQGRHALHNTRNNTFCALGVLCETFKDLVGIPTEDGYDKRSYGEDAEIHTLPSEIADALGVFNNPVFSSGAYTDRSFIDLNDINNISFSEFADLLENHGIR